MSALNFPQPEVEAPEVGAITYYTCEMNGVSSRPWRDAYDLTRLKAGNVYLSFDEAKARQSWNAQETARLVTPQWFRVLGDDVQYKVGGEWARFAPESAKFVPNWSQEKPENYRAKPAPKAAPDVVKVLDGVEYRWPATVTQGDPMGPRYIARLNKVSYRKHSCMSGNRSHFTRGGAEAQNAMLVAALGGAA